MSPTNPPQRGVQTPACPPGKAEIRAHYERHLPHQVPAGFPIFLTWNLKGSLPQRILAELELERQRLANEPQRRGETEQDRKLRHAKIAFAVRDRFLDTAGEGPLHLRDPRAAKVMVESIIWGVPARYDLYAWAVMHNHAHVLFTPQVDLEVCTQGIKGYTAYRINGLQNERNRVFWQDESYDHWARDEEEMHRIIAYIENNPVVAGLSQQPDQWPWSSAAWRARLRWPRGVPFRPEWKTNVTESTSGFPA